MGEAAESGALDRHRLRVERVDLDDPAEVVRFVAVVVLGLLPLRVASKRSNSSPARVSQPKRLVLRMP
ncbi:hypothetical protein P4233_16730 [Pseudomonas aeruginosa]|nr:hypothetical protein [Pseudomonas aeruginosa]